MRMRLRGEQKDRHNLRKREAIWMQSASHKVSLGMFECGSWQEATSKAGKAPTTTKWIDRVKKDDGGREYVRCRLVARDSKLQEPRTKNQQHKSDCQLRWSWWYRSASHGKLGADQVASPSVC